MQDLTPPRTVPPDRWAQHDGPVVLGVRSLRSIPLQLRKNLVVVRAPRRHC